MKDQYALNMLSVSGDFEEEKKYWLQKLHGELTPVTFPYDFSTANLAPTNRMTKSYEWPQQLAEQLLAFCNDSDYGLYMTVLSAFPFLLHTYTQHDDMVIGSPVFRDEQQAAPLNQMLPLRMTFDGMSSFKATLSDVKRTVMEASEHEHYPLHRIFNEHNMDAERFQSTLYRVVVLLDQIHDSSYANGLDLDMLFAIQRQDQLLNVTVSYNTSLYKESTIDNIVRHLTLYLQAVLHNPAIRMMDIDIVEAHERQRLLIHFNNTQAAYDKSLTIQHVFEQQVKRTPHRIAIVCGDEQWTYEQLNEQSNSLAHVLRSKGVVPNACVGVVTDRSLSMVMSMLAIVKAGGAYVPIDPAYPDDRIAYMLDNCGAQWVVAHSQYVDQLSRLSEEIEVIDLSQLTTRSTDNLEPLASSGDMAYIIFTSGTTGKPKGVMVEHRNVIRLFIHDKPLFDFGELDVWTLFHSYCFDFSVWEMYGALLFGGKLVVIPKHIAQDPQQFLNVCIQEKVSVLNQTPSSFYNLIQYELEQKLPELQLRYVIFGGEALKPAMLKPFKQRYEQTKLVNMYGITETTVHVTYKEITKVEMDTNVSNIGKPIPTLRCYILDSHLNVVPQGIVGELFVGGEGVARGYIHNESLTNEKFIMDPFRPSDKLYRSGDLVRWSDDGELEYYGRIDHQVKIRGHRIELGEIETNLLKYEHIRECLMIARKDDSGQSDILAYYVADEVIPTATLRAHVANDLPEFMIPAYFIHLTSMPLTDNGKIDRKALPLPDLNKAVGSHYVAPHTPLEQRISELWMKVLQLEQVGVNDNFFTIGGDSIKVIRFISQFNKSEGTHLSVADFYKQPTIAELADWLSKHSLEGINERAEGLQQIDQFKNRLSAEVAQLPLLDSADDYYPLSSIQMSMVFYSKLKPEEPIYHDQFYYVLEFAQFDQELLGQAIRMLSAKHPILRTAMDLERYSEPIQIVYRDRMPELVLEDVSTYSREAQERRIQAYMALDLSKKFQFKDQLLWRLGVFQLSSHDVCIVLSFHHAILDGWSVATFNKELLEVYNSLLRGEEVVVRALQSSYKDYVGIQMYRSASVETEQFWNQYLDGYVRNKLPYNLAAKRVSNQAVSVIYRNEVNQELLLELDQLTEKYGFTLREICFAAYLYLMHIVTTESELVTGIVTHDRPAIEDGENILGCFLNTLPFRTTIQRSNSIVAFMKDVQQRLQQIITHDLQLVDIAKLIGESHHHASNPIFDALFNYTDFHILEDVGQQGEVKGSDYELELQSSEMTNTLFDLEVTRTWNQLGIQIKYDKSFFYDSEIESAFHMYLRILRHFVADPEAALQDIELLTDDERQHIVYDFNDTETPYADKKTMHMLFEEQAIRTPDHIALKMDGATITYEQLNAKANQVAAMLISHGVQSGHHVALIAERGFDMIIGMYGILKAGAAYVPIDPEYPLARKQYITEHAQATALLADGDYGLDIKNTLFLHPDAYNQYSTESHDIPKDSRELAYIIYTSGSTGNPKGVMIEHHSAVNLMQWVNKRFTVGDDDTLLFITSMCFDLSVYDIFGMLACGGTIFVTSKEQVHNHQELIRILQHERITFWDSVPSTMNHLVNMINQESTDFVQTHLRLVFMSGDWIPVNLPDRIKQLFPNAEVISLGGATEATVWSNYYPVEAVSDIQSSIPYGNPMDNNYFYILDENLNAVPFGVAGELYIGGVGVARGYMSDVEKTTSAFVANPFLSSPLERMYKTGDLGRMLPSGVMEFLGRKDHQVKIRGFRVELGEIESQLFKLEHIREAVVVDKLDPDGVPYLCAYVVFDQVMTSQQLRDALSSKLPGYMVPSIFIPLERLPLTSNGKIDRKALPEPDESVQMGSEYEGPRDLVEEKLVQIWKDVLGKDQIGIHDHFFEIGGHSLLATSLALKINREFAVNIPLLSIFTYPTISEFAVNVRNAEQSTYRQIERVENRDYYPLSSAQHRMFILNQIEGEGLQYNSPVAFVVEGSLDPVRLEASFRQLLNRHEILRTSFSLLDSSPVQHIHSDTEWSIERYECDDHVGNVESVIHSFVRPFDLQRAPLLRVGLINWTNGRQMLLFDMHHIISDGVSMGILIQEFIACYEQQQLPQSRIQYKDFAVWQQEIFDIEAQQEQEGYWLSKLGGELPVLNIAADYPRPSVKSFDGARIQFSADQHVLEGLQRIAAQTGSTLYMVLLAAYNVLLARYTGQSDIIVGTPIAGRAHVDVERMLGVFINTLAMRNAPQLDHTFEQLLLEVKDNALQAYANQDYPFEQLVEKLNVRKDVSRNPIFDTMFLLQNVDQTEYEIAGLTFTQYEFEHNAAKLDITLEAIELSDRILFRLEYSTKLFKLETIKRMSDHWMNILQSIVADPTQRLVDIKLISNDEEQQIVTEFNNTSIAYESDKAIYESFAEQASIRPDQVAVVFENEKLTYRELDERSNQLARVLRERGVTRDTVVGLMAERSLELFIGIYGILKAGGAYLPMDPEYPQERLDYMLQDSGAKLVLTHTARAVDVSAEVIQLSDEQLYSGDSGALQRLSKQDDLAFIIYTSGSTGKPKGVMIVHQAISNLLVGLKQEIAFQAGQSILTLTSISFDIFAVESLIPLAAGMTLVAPAQQRERDLRSLESFISEHPVKMIQLTPSRLRMLMDGQCYSVLRQLDAVMLGGEALPTDLLRELKTVTSARIYNMYGPTETTVYSTIRELTDTDEVVIGKPIANTRMYVLDSMDRIQPVGIIGELCIAGDGLARGYWNRRDLTDEKFVVDPYQERSTMYRSGDLAKWLPDGNLMCMGRIDHQVKLRGYRIELGEIEASLRQHVAVKDAVVVARQEDDSSPYLCAYVVGDEGVTIGKYREHLMLTLPEYMVPSFFIKLEQIPMTPNGKVDRRALPEPDGNLHSGVEYVAPRNELEAKLAEIWQELLGVELVGRDHHFFELGGHSLKAMVLVSRIHKEMGVDVPVRDIFQYPVLLNLSSYIESLEAQAYIGIPVAPVREYYPLSDAQRRMFILNQIEAQGIQYNSPNAFIIDGLLDEQRLTAVFQSLIHRHDILRTTFIMNEGVPVQHISTDIQFMVEHYELGDGDASIEDIINQFVRPFDLSVAPQLRVGLVKLADDRQALLFDMHHIISDGVTMGILVREFIALYEGEQLPVQRIQYKDYATWQQEATTDHTLRDKESYWLTKFAGEIPVLNLPTDYMRPAIASYEGNRIHFRASKRMTEQLHQLAAVTGGTLYMALLAAYNVLLLRYSGQEDIVIGTPIAGRHHADLEDMLGIFINTLAMRNAPQLDKTFEQLLLEVKDNALQAYANQDYPFEQLVDKLNVQKDLSRNPLFDTMFILQNMDQVQLNIEGVTLQPYSFELTTAKYDLTLEATEDADGIRFTLEFSTKLFNLETIKRMSCHWVNILQSIITDPTQRLADIKMISEADEQQIITEFNNTSIAYESDKAIYESFAEQASIRPDLVAVQFEHEKLTYRELDERSNQLARVLRSRGVTSNTVVGLMAERSLELFIGIYGILKAGGAYLPMDPEYPLERLDYMLQDSGAKLVLTHTARAVDVSAEVIQLSDEQLYSGDNGALEPQSKQDDLAYMIYTSGSTGKPKGVMIVHQAVSNLLAGLKQEIPFPAGQSILTLTSISFDIFVVESLIPLAAGMTLIAPAQQRERDLRSLESFITEYPVKMMQLTPSRLRMLLDGQCYDMLRQLDAIMVGGEAFPADLLRELKTITSARIYNMYGPTETTVWSAVRELTDTTEVVIGKPIANTRMYVLDSLDRIQPVGIIGELCIAGDGLARGYWNRLDLTEEKFVNDPSQAGSTMYRTGDLAKWLPDGNLVYMGRIDHQVKIRGYRIELGEIEASLRQHAAVRDAVVVARQDDNRSSYLCAYVVVKDEITISNYREHLMLTLPEYMIPSYFIQLEQIPMTPNGKVDRKALPEADGQLHSGVEYVAPRNEIEAKLVEIWQDILELDRIGVNDDFFDLGGNSIQVVRLHMALERDELLPERDTALSFQYRTIAGLAGYIEALPTLINDEEEESS